MPDGDGEVEGLKTVEVIYDPNACGSCGKPLKGNLVKAADRKWYTFLIFSSSFCLFTASLSQF